MSELGFLVRWRDALAGLLVAGTCLSLSCDLDVEPFEQSQIEGNVGLDVDIVNGAGKTLRVLPADGFYINQLRFQVRQTDFPVPEVLEWVQQQTELSGLDWTGTTRVITEFEFSRGTWEEFRGHLNAGWMSEPPSFAIEVYDADGNRTAGPIDVAAESYVYARQTALSWVEGEPAKGQYGSNAGSYPNLTIATGGDFTGPNDDIYDVEVVTGGALDGTAVISIASVRGDDVDERAVLSGVPIALGSLNRGASITFTDAGGTELLEGDRWTVSVTAENAAAEIEAAVGPAEPGTAARFNAIAEVRLQYPHALSIESFQLTDAAEMRVTWLAKPGQTYVVPVEVVTPESDAPGYGLQTELTVNVPASGYYLPGDTVEVSLTLKDGAGNRLHPEGNLPTYRQYADGDSNGIMYFSLSNDPSLSFFTENRLNLMRFAVFGPRQRVEQDYTGDSAEYFIEEVNLPDIGGVIMAGRAPPHEAWDTPIPDHAEFEIPEDAEPGSYVALAKIARTYHGESIYREEHVDFVVGDAGPTVFDNDVGNCTVCHTGEARLERLRHGISTDSPQFCQPCHTPPNSSPIGVVVHRVHFFSDEYPVRKSGCSLCHLSRESNTRASIAMCGACHGAIHPGEEIEFDPDPYAQCGQTCHAVLPEIHVISTSY